MSQKTLEIGYYQSLILIPKEKIILLKFESNSATGWSLNKL